jgi:hypothetical protein
MRRRRISRSVLSCRTLLTDRHKRSPGAVSFASTHRKRVDGSAAEVPIWSGAGLILINDWSGDGQYLLLTLFDTSNPGIEVWLLPNLSSPSVTRGPVRFDTGGRGIGHVQFVPSQGPPLGITTDGVVVRGMLGRSQVRGRSEARMPVCHGGAGTGGSSSSTTMVTCRLSNERDRPRTSSLDRRAASSRDRSASRSPADSGRRNACARERYLLRRRAMPVHTAPKASSASVLGSGTACGSE